MDEKKLLKSIYKGAKALQKKDGLEGYIGELMEDNLRLIAEVEILSVFRDAFETLFHSVTDVLEGKGNKESLVGCLSDEIAPLMLKGKETCEKYDVLDRDK